MPKMKTNRAAAKRFKRTASGKFKRSKAFRGHLSGSKSTKRQRQLRKTAHVDKTDEGRVKCMLPYDV